MKKTLLALVALGSFGAGAAAFQNNASDASLQAPEIMDSIDSGDAVFLAASLAYNKCPIWSNDKHFKKQNLVPTFTTQELIRMLQKF